MIIVKSLFIFFYLLSYTNAAIYDYGPPEILARANILDGYNIPPMSFLNHSSPMINNRGDIIFKVMTIEGERDQGIWVKMAEEETGKIVYIAPDERFLSVPSINENRKIVFNLYDEGVTDGLFLFDIKSSNIKQVLNPDHLGVEYYTYPQLANNGHIFFRATDNKNNRSYYLLTKNGVNKIISEGVDKNGLKSSFLFRPAINESGLIAFKTRKGDLKKWDDTNPDSIVLIDQKNPEIYKTIAVDRDTDLQSPYLKFGNSVALSRNGMIAFTVLLDDLKKAIVIYKDGVLSNVAIEGKNDISKIDEFTPKINELGHVLFRARDMQQKSGIYLADGNNVKKIIGEGDEIKTDLGQGTILSNPNYPGLIDEMDMNDRGEIVFNCIILSLDNKELGSAIFKIAPI